MFELKIITPEKIMFDKSVKFVEFKTVDGSMGTLQNRLPLFAALAIFELEAEDENGHKSTIAIHGGIGEFSKNIFTILSDAAEKSEEIDVERARKALERARTDIENVEDAIKRKALELKIQRALVRLKISEKEERRSD